MNFKNVDGFSKENLSLKKKIYLFDTILGFEFTALCIDAILLKNTFLVALLQAVVNLYQSSSRLCFTLG